MPTSKRPRWSISIATASRDKPFFMSINFMKVHQPNMPHPDYKHKSMSKSKYADSIVENDARIGHIMDKLRELGLDDGNTLVFWTTDNGAWQDVYPDAGYTPFRGTKGTDREGGNRVPAIAWMPKKIKADQQEPRHHRRARLHGHVRRDGRRQASGERSGRQADDLRQLRHEPGPLRHWQEPARDLVLLHRKRAAARRGALSQLTSSCSTSAATTAHTPADWPSTATSAGKARRSTSPPSRRSSTSGPIRRNATTCS